MSSLLSTPLNPQEINILGIYYKPGFSVGSKSLSQVLRVTGLSVPLERLLSLNCMFLSCRVSAFPQVLDLPRFLPRSVPVSCLKSSFIISVLQGLIPWDT